MAKIFIVVFFISLVPLLVLRGAIPGGVALFSSLLGLGEGALSVKYVVLINLFAMVGNMIPVPFIYFFARKFLEWGSSRKFIGKFCSFFLVKGKKGGEKLEQKAGKGLFFALFLFVGIPLPGTGAWTGTLAASLLDMKGRQTVLSVLCGVFLAALLMTLASCGVFGALGVVFA
ncbi:small multi-drug export protein [Treponema berlinense]|uniref:COG2426 family protein n=1 Tax=Treponema berlinense TaxID=225004 RepID=UPI0026F03BCF|nr:small multi-drug export protein [Treponema berlinense]